MQKWEYRTLAIVGSDVRWSVIGIDGDREVAKVKKAKGPPEYLSLPTYLATVGQEGWEVAGVSLAGEMGGFSLLILKRPI